MESHDSCYSSCSEESRSSPPQHPTEIAQLSVTAVETSAADSVTEQHLLLQNIDFATRLGYSVEQLETVLRKLGINARQVSSIDLIPFAVHFQFHLLFSISFNQWQEI